MPLRSENPIIRVETGSMHTIDTRNVENLFGLWSVFSKCAETMPEGKRLENLSWRLWNRETFCCAPEFTPRLSSRWNFEHRPQDNTPEEVPALSRASSIDSVASLDAQLEATTLTATSPIRPELRRGDSSESHNRGKEKHITPVDLEKIVVSIKECREISPLSPLPESLTVKPASAPSRIEETTPRATSPPPHTVQDSSTSTVATAVRSDLSDHCPAQDSDTSTSDSAHSVVRGFSPGRICSSFRSKTQLAPTQPTPILRNFPLPTTVEPPKRKGATFTIGTGSSGEQDDSSLESRYALGSRYGRGQSSVILNGLAKARQQKKQTSFKEEVDVESAIESDSEDDGSAIEEEEEPSSAIGDDDWEDDDEAAGSSTIDEGLFQRVDSRPNLTSRRSLLTTQLTEKDRAAAMMQNALSKPQSHLRRSRVSSHNPPSTGPSPPRIEPGSIDETVMEMRGPQGASSRPRPIIMTTSNTVDAPPALSPRTTRINMLGKELTGSLRKNLLWERQQKNSTSNAALNFKRRHTSNDLKNLNQYPGESRTAVLRENIRNPNSWTKNNTRFFDSGLGEYHERGW